MLHSILALTPAAWISVFRFPTAICRNRLACWRRRYGRYPLKSISRKTHKRSSWVPRFHLMGCSNFRYVWSLGLLLLSICRPLSWHLFSQWLLRCCLFSIRFGICWYVSDWNQSPTFVSKITQSDIWASPSQLASYCTLCWLCKIFTLSLTHWQHWSSSGGTKLTSFSKYTQSL